LPGATHNQVFELVNPSTQLLIDEIIWSYAKARHLKKSLSCVIPTIGTPYDFMIKFFTEKSYRVPIPITGYSTGSFRKGLLTEVNELVSDT
jgi:hypothetical protein